MPNDLNNMKQTIHAQKEQIVRELSEIIKRPSVSATGEGIEACAEFTKEFVQKCGLEAELVCLEGVEDSYPFIIGEADIGAEKTVLIYNHYDVQPPEPSEGWISPPFEPEIREERIYGRGTADNKGNIVARGFAIKSLLESENGLPVNIKWLIEGEEETGSPNIKKFIQEHAERLKADGAIWEFGGVDWEERPNLWAGLKGILYVELMVKSTKVDSHSALATYIPNAAWRLCHALNLLKSKDEILIPGFYDDVLKPSEEEKELVKSLPMGEKEQKKRLGISEFLGDLSGDKLRLHHFFEPTLNICGINSGYTGSGSKTVIPSRAFAKIDFRLVANQTHEDIFEKLSVFLKSEGFDDIQLTKHGSSNPAKTPIEHPWVKTAVKTAEEVFGKPAVVYPTSGGSGPMDSISQLGLPCISFGVADESSNGHAPNESISISNLLQGTLHVVHFLKEWSKS